MLVRSQSLTKHWFFAFPPPKLQPRASEQEPEQAPTLCWSKARTDYISGLGAGLTFISRLAGLTFISRLAGISFISRLAGLTFISRLAGFTFISRLAGLTFISRLAGHFSQIMLNSALKINSVLIGQFRDRGNRRALDIKQRHDRAMTTPLT